MASGPCLRRHEGGGAEETVAVGGAEGVHRRARRLTRQRRKTEVHKFDHISSTGFGAKEDVGRFHVAVQHLCFVCVGETRQTSASW